MRLSACTAEQPAFEYQGADGKQIGMFTEALVLALDAAGSAPISWAAVLDYVSGRVLTLSPSQRPEIAGPFRRLLFDTAEQDPLSALPATNSGAGRASLACAPLLGVQRGDRFVIMPPGEAKADPWAGAGLLEVDRVGPLAAEGWSSWAALPRCLWAPGRFAWPPRRPRRRCCFPPSIRGRPV